MIESSKHILTVANINAYIKALLSYDSNLNGVYVGGEISGFRKYNSGHCYFSLKDSSGVLKCVMFASSAGKMAFTPSDGMKVVAYGNITVYEKDGAYQLNVQRMEPDGIGALYQRYEELKKKLEGMGYFDESVKKPLPFLPKAVGVVTSPDGAVIQDIRNVVSRRFPNMPIILYPASVQGEGSAAQIAAKIAKAGRDMKVDVLIVGRGGGSIEDLWSFNEEIVAEAVYNCPIPVISAVGHETDFTICDFVADRRAPTPSAAAELAVPEYDSLTARLEELETRIKLLPKENIRKKRQELEKAAKYRYFTDPIRMITEKKEILARYEISIEDEIHDMTDDFKKRIEFASRQMAALGPDNVLKRGYAIIYDNNDKLLKTPEDIDKAGSGRIKMSGGNVGFKVDKE